jgi:ribose transport system substrate-binding protein
VDVSPSGAYLRSGRRTTRFAVVISVALTGVALAACSSSGSGSSGNGSSAKPSSDSPTGSTSVAASGGVAEANKFIAAYLKAPTAITISAPLPTKPSGRKTVVYLQASDVPGDNYAADQFEEAASSIGWIGKTISYQGAQPATVKAAFDNALALRPAMVAITGVPQSLWGSDTIAAYKKAGVRIVQNAVLPSTDPWVIGTSNNPDSYRLDGKIIGSWVVSDSKGSGHALVVSIPAYQLFAPFVSDMKAQISSECAKCKTDEIDLTVPQIANGQAVSAVVSKVRETGANYLVYGYGPTSDGIRSALQTAGLKNVVVAGAYPDTQDLGALKSGGSGAWVASDIGYSSWMDIDMFLRTEEKTDLPDGSQSIPIQLLTKATAADVGDRWIEPKDYREQFKKLWHVG